MAVVAATAVAEAAAAAAVAARLASLLYRRSPVRGRSQACRAHLQLMVSSASQCPPYLMALPQEFLQTLSPWPARLLAICRNFPRAIWAPRRLNLIRGPLARNRWTRKSWNDSWTAFLCLFSVCLGRFSWLTLCLFGFAQSISNVCYFAVCVTFCSSWSLFITNVRVRVPCEIFMWGTWLLRTVKPPNFPLLLFIQWSAVLPALKNKDMMKLIYKSPNFWSFSMTGKLSATQVIP